jgi:hypothetical protein
MLWQIGLWRGDTQVDASGVRHVRLQTFPLARRVCVCACVCVCKVFGRGLSVLCVCVCAPYRRMVNEGCEAEYEKRHSPIWQELQDVLRAHGAHNYSIFLLPSTRQVGAAGTVVCGRSLRGVGAVAVLVGRDTP